MYKRQLEDSMMIRDAVKFIGAVQFITVTIARCCLEYFDQLIVLAPIMEERIKKRHYDGVEMCIRDRCTACLPIQPFHSYPSDA